MVERVVKGRPRPYAERLSRGLAGCDLEHGVEVVDDFPRASVARSPDASKPGSVAWMPVRST
jgi:hypothetical protein